MLAVYHFLRHLPHNRPMIGLLVLVNGLGTVYGFWWYHEQLRATPPLYWPVVPDSPGASLLFTLLLIVLLAGRCLGAPEGAGGPRVPGGVAGRLLAAFAYLTMIKYGLWTVFVMGHLWLTEGVVPFDSTYLSASHLGMAIEAALFLRVYRPGWVAGAVAGAWLLFNDYMDYLHGFHPRLPVPEAVGLVAGLAVALSLFAIGWYAWVHLCTRSES